jgi:CRP-like cAMP-binding protein
MKPLDFPLDELLAGTRYLAGSPRCAILKPRDTIYHTGSPGDYIYLIRRGLVKLVRYSSSGAERIVQVARQGDTIGMSALLRRPYGRTAMAMTDVELSRVPADLVASAARSQPRLGENLMARFQASLDSADVLLAELSTGDAEARIARLLLFLMDEEQSGESYLPSREDVGALVGTTTETASRAVAAFRRRGLIEPASRDRCRCNVTALKRLAEA